MRSLRRRWQAIWRRLTVAPEVPQFVGLPPERALREIEFQQEVDADSRVLRSTVSARTAVKRTIPAIVVRSKERV